jgi:hypothetical protein
MAATGYAAMDTAAKAIMALVNSASSLTVTQAPTNHGTDFRIASGTVRYQIQITPMPDYHRGTVQYPRATVTVLMHFYSASLANEEAFAENAMGHMADQFLPPSKWTAQSGIFGLDPEEEAEIAYEGREGNVISYAATATVLADGA